MLQQHYVTSENSSIWFRSYNILEVKGRTYNNSNKTRCRKNAIAANIELK